MGIGNTVIEQKLIEGVAVLVINGRLDSMAADTVKNKISSMPLHGYKNVVVDLSQVSLIDSSGISSLVTGLYNTKKNNGILKLAAPTQAVSEAFQLINFDRIFEIFTDTDNAVKSF